MIDKIKTLWKSERGKALIKLGLYFIFFFFVLSLALFTPRGNTNTDDIEESTEEIVKELTYIDKQNILINGNYEFIYTITGSTNIIYSGEKENNIITGYKETIDETIKYSIEDGVIYKVILGEKQEYTELYSEIDENIVDFEELFDKLNGVSTLITKEEDLTIYTYALNDTEYIIKFDSEHIVNIVVSSNDISYDLVFKYQGGNDEE